MYIHIIEYRTQLLNDRIHDSFRPNEQIVQSVDSPGSQHGTSNKNTTDIRIIRTILDIHLIRRFQVRHSLAAEPTDALLSCLERDSGQWTVK